MSIAPTVNQLRATKPVKFLPLVTNGRISKVYDGDSYHLACYLAKGGPLYYFPLRLRGVDTPELRTKSENEKKMAIAARDYAKELVFEKEVEIKEVEREKYGRLLCDVYIEGKSLCDLLISAGHGRPYSGGTRGSWD